MFITLLGSFALAISTIIYENIVYRYKTNGFQFPEFDYLEELLEFSEQKNNFWFFTKKFCNENYFVGYKDFTFLDYIEFDFQPFYYKGDSTLIFDYDLILCNLENLGGPALYYFENSYFFLDNYIGWIFCISFYKILSNIDFYYIGFEFLSLKKSFFYSFLIDCIIGRSEFFNNSIPWYNLGWNDVFLFYNKNIFYADIILDTNSFNMDIMYHK